MAVVALELLNTPESELAPPPIQVLILARLACGNGVTRAELAKDLTPLTGHRWSPAELRRCIESQISGLLAKSLCVESRHQISLTPSGTERAQAVLGLKPAAKVRPLVWSDIRDVRLVAVALGIAQGSSVRVQALARPDGLRAAILQRSFGLSIKGSPTPARLRSALAVVALERAFGNKIKGGFGAGDGLAAKAGRLLASQLSAKPREFGTDSRLIAALAAEHAGSHQNDIEAVRSAVLRDFAVKPARLPGSIEARVAAAAAPAAKSAVVAPQPLPQTRPAAASRPDLKGFAEQIQIAARGCAEGWPGNRKAYISDVWQVLRDGRPEWGLTEVEFKGMLAEAHRTGFVVLANADLKDRQTIGRLQKSAIAFKNTVLHFVRVED